MLYLCTDSFVLRCMCAVLGIWVREEGARDLGAHVIVSNCNSSIDSLAIDLVAPNIVVSMYLLVLVIV